MGTTVFLLSSKSLLNFVKKAPLTHIQITMKLVSASVLFLGSVMADKWSHLGDLWQQLGQANNVGEDDRKIIELFTISSVANYGCWCRFGQYRPYKGQAQDVVDEACKTWHQNYDCLNIDYNTDGTTPCNMDTEYNDVSSVFPIHLIWPPIMPPPVTPPTQVTHALPKLATSMPFLSEKLSYSWPTT